MRIIGIDVGKTGAITEIDLVNRQINFMRMPWRGDNIDSLKINYHFDLSNARIIVEDVHADRAMSAKSAFSFGYNVGQMLQIISRYDYEMVNPLTWQAAFTNCLRDTIDDPKERALNVFRAYNPEFNKMKYIKAKHNGMIDAYFVACYGAVHNWGLKIKDVSDIKRFYELT
jgi:hypothetical protein